MNNQNQSPAPKLTPELTPEQQPTKKPKPKWLIPVIVIVGVIVIGLIAWGAYELFKPAPPEEPAEGEEEPITEDEFKDWKTYRNEEYGFEVGHPDFFEFQEPKEQPFENEVWLGYFDMEDGGQLSMTVKQEKLDFNNIQGFYGKVDKENLKTTIVDNITAYMYIEGDAGCGGYVVNIPANDLTIRLRFTDCESDKNKIEDSRDQILSTFKFID